MAKDVIGDKRKCVTQEKFLEAMQEMGARAKFARLTEKAQFNGLDQKLYEKDDPSIKEREDKL